MVNHKKVKRLMRELGLYPVAYKRSIYSSYKGEVGKRAPNILKRAFDVKAPDTVWATDVTEFQTDEGKLYFSPIKDLCTGEIIRAIQSHHHQTWRWSWECSMLRSLHILILMG